MDCSRIEHPGGVDGLGRQRPSGETPAAIAEFRKKLSGAMLEAAATDPAGRLSIDYADLPGAVWQRVAPHFGLEADSAAIERMIEESRFYSKDPSPRIFDGDASERRLMTDAMRKAAERFAEPGYRALASLR